MKKDKILIVGAGFSGAVIARELANVGYEIEIIDEREHIAGNCFTKRDINSEIMLHMYGPHIFHTDDEEVWNYVNEYARFVPYVNRVKATHNGEVYSLPINLHTINQLYRTSLTPAEAEKFLENERKVFEREPQNFEEQAESMVGEKIYNAFFKGYTCKQWGCSPKMLPAAILKRLPVRFNYDDNYFYHKYQGMPENGYTEIVANLLKHPNITTSLKTSFSDVSDSSDYHHIFYSGTLDGYFNYELGRLGYRTLDFERIDAEGDYQGCAVMNYTDESVPHTRISEHKHFSPWESHSKTVCFKEFSRAAEEGDIPYYPIRLTEEKQLLIDYVERAKLESGITFVGRLGTYRYLDMDVTIKEALNTAQDFIKKDRNNSKVEAFYISPI